MANQNRKSALCAQNKLTGIDFVQVLDHEVQDILHVYFVVNPDDLVPPLTDTSIFSIISDNTGLLVEIETATWKHVGPANNRRTVLELKVKEPGDFSKYTVSTGHGPDAHEQIDHFFSEAEFSFKQACPTGLDCQIEHSCPDTTKKQVNIDYMARDYTSFRGALLDFAAQYYPEWESMVEADQAVMLLEIMAVLGDEFAYTQDRYSFESYLETATQPQSIINLARLVDYEVDRGHAASATLTIGAKTAHFTNPQDLSNSAALVDRVYAVREGSGVIPFEATERIWIHPDWNEVALHIPDASAPCLSRGATRAYLKTALPTLSDLPPGTDITQIPDIWVGRKVVLRSGINAPDEPDRAWAVTITGLESFTDELCLDDFGNPVDIVCIEWSPDESLPFEMSTAHTTVNLNTVQAIAGETITETFRVGRDSDFTSLGLTPTDLEKTLALSPAIEREAACTNGVRGVITRYGLQQSAEKGLSWHRALPFRPALPAIYIKDWNYIDDILSSDAEDQVYTLEQGLWDETVRYQKPSGDVVHREYVGSHGFTVRFGDGAFGRAPVAGSTLEVTYLSAPGADANLPQDTVHHIITPGSDPEIVTFADVVWVTNPFPTNVARTAETLDSIRINAPEAYKAIPLRAVRNEDYQTIIERETTIQKANANTRWTGSWATDFVVVDPVGTTQLKPDLRVDIENRLDCIRQAGRDVCLNDAGYLSIDFKICICVEPGSSNATTIKNVTTALTGGHNVVGFFDNDNFTFGNPLIRSQLEAAIQCVNGVRAIESIDVHIHGYQGFTSLSNRIEIAPYQIIQVANNKAHPEKGYVQIDAHGGG